MMRGLSAGQTLHALWMLGLCSAVLLLASYCWAEDGLVLAVEQPGALWRLHTQAPPDPDVASLSLERTRGGVIATAPATADQVVEWLFGGEEEPWPVEVRAVAIDASGNRSAPSNRGLLFPLACDTNEDHVLGLGDALKLNACTLAITTCPTSPRDIVGHCPGCCDLNASDSVTATDGLLLARCTIAWITCPLPRP